MTEIGSGIGLTDHAATLRVYRGFILFKSCCLDVDLAKAGEECTIAGITGGHHTVKHIHAARYILHQILWCTYTHEIARLICGHKLGYPFDRIIHILIGLSDTEASDSKAIKVQSAEFGR